MLCCGLMNESHDIPRLPGPPPPPVSPGNQPLVPLQRVNPPTELQVAEMVAEEARFKDTPEVRETALRFLGAGYTVRETARRLRLRASTLLCWANEPEMKEAIERGRQYRQKMLGHDLESAAEGAVRALADIAEDSTIAAKDRVKASEVILDRCGLVERVGGGQTVAVAVDVDFDERLARIVAGGTL